MRIGMFVWRIWNLPSLNVLIPYLIGHGITDLCIKIADGLYKYNQVDAAGNQIGNDSYLKVWCQAMEDADIHVHGWHFVYTQDAYSPGGQAAVAGERYQKLNLKSLKIDAEDVPGLAGANWSSSAYATRSAKIYMNGLSAYIAKKEPVGIDSYRFPSLFPNFPWRQFLKDDAGHGDHTAPQVYWALATNAGAQLQRSYDEYASRVDFSDYDFEPVGAMFGANFNNQWWEPAAEEIKDFMVVAGDLGCKQVWFYSLDYVWSKERTDWIIAATGVKPPPVEPPPPPPPPPPPVTEGLSFRVMDWVELGLVVRDGPGTQFAKVGGLRIGDVIEAQDVAGESAWVQIKSGPYAGKWCAVQFGDNVYLEVV